MPGLLERFSAAPALTCWPGEQLGHRHAVLGERAGLVDRQHSGTTQTFDRRRPARQHADAGQAQGTERQKQGQHYRDLIGQHRQRQGQGR